MNDFRTNLTAGFKALRAQGYFARQSWQCCQSCGCAALPGKDDNYAFYHRQDAERLQAAEVAHRNEDIGVYLSWAGDGNLIAQTFRDAGCAVIWDGNGSTRIWVCPQATGPGYSLEDAEYRVKLERLVS